MQNKLEKVFLAAKGQAEGVSGLERIRGLAPSSTNYGIFITPRSGSTFLTHAIRDTEVLGIPDEWFNHGSIGALVSRLGVDNIKDYIFAIRRTLRTSNGVFGFEISWPQFAFLRELIDIGDAFDPALKWFILRRKNIVAQGVSLAIANQTGVFHSYQLSRGSVDDILKQVSYDAEQLVSTIRMIHNQELAIQRFFTAQGIRPIGLYYEQIVGDPASALAAIRACLGVVDKPLGNRRNSIHKLATPINTEFEQRFRREHPGLIAELEHGRWGPDPGAFPERGE